MYRSTTDISKIHEIARFMGPTWGPISGQQDPGGTPWWPHEPCYLGHITNTMWREATSLEYYFLGKDGNVEEALMKLHCHDNGVYASLAAITIATGWCDGDIHVLCLDDHSVSQMCAYHWRTHKVKMFCYLTGLKWNIYFATFEKYNILIHPTCLQNLL